MNAVEIEEAVSALAAAPFDPADFPFQFLAAFGNKDTTIKRLRSGSSNGSDVGGVLQRNNVHLAVAPAGQVSATLAALRDSPRTLANKAKFILATDGETFEAEDLASGEAIAAPFVDMARQFGFFLPLAGISTVPELKNNPVDIKATGRLNKLYVELLRTNPDWDTAERRPALNQLMARLIFCFFAEDTGIFHASYLFTPTVDRMSDAQSTNTHEVIGELFRAMGTPVHGRAAAGFRTWADGFPYVNGGLFTGDGECPRFSKLARAYLISAGSLDWKEINPDIFGSMIQAVADEGERGALGMHYTSVPNILKVLNPLFLDSLREQLEAAGDSRAKLRNLRRRLSTIRVFDPACGSGNFLVIAYKQMREIEAEVVRRLGGEANLRLEDRRSVIPLSNFYGIEIKSFAAEIARLALLIAEFQADCVYLSQQEARSMVLPLHKTGQVTVGNALRVDWLKVCPPAGATVGAEHDLAGPTGRLALEGEWEGPSIGGETYICGNPPYLGSTWQSADQKSDLSAIFQHRTALWKSLDYVAGWFMKAADYGTATFTRSAFVSTNSICQGQQVPILWPLIFGTKRTIIFAHTSFKWANLASHNAGVTVVIVGLAGSKVGGLLYTANDDGVISTRSANHINAYLIDGPDIVVEKASTPISDLTPMDFGSKPVDGGYLLLDTEDQEKLELTYPERQRFIKRVLGSYEYINGITRYCIWVSDADNEPAKNVPVLAQRFALVAEMRSESPKARTRQGAAWPFRFDERRQRGDEVVTILPRISSENRLYLPVGHVEAGTIITDLAFGLYNAPLWNMALIASRLHLVWIATVCGKMKTDFRYSNTMGWNTFPVPKLTEQNKADLTRCAEAILLAREAHFPATIADLYDPDAMPDNLREAHEANDETLERIYIGRRFRNDTERLEKLFELYTRMTAEQPAPKKGRKAA